jgi:transmembrane sensor
MDQQDQNDLNKSPSNSDASSNQDKARIRAEILDRIHQSRLNNDLAAAANRRKKTLRIWWSLGTIAAILILTFVASRFIFQEPPATEWVVITNPKGHIRQVTLPDSTLVWMNAGAQMRYPASYGTKERLLELQEGEIFLEVQPDVAQPFRVQSGSLNIQVLGTSFVVKSYQRLNNMAIAVKTGKVAVKQQLNELGALTPGEVLEYDPAKKTFFRANQDVNEIGDWRQGKVVLKQAGFDAIALAIENAFNVNLQYNHHSFQHCVNSIRFNRQQPLTEVLDILRDIQHIKYTIKGDTVLITGQGCN